MAIVCIFSKLSDKEGDVVPVSHNNILLRGCVMRNTDWIEGLVCYGGKLHTILTIITPHALFGVHLAGL